MEQLQTRSALPRIEGAMQNETFVNLINLNIDKISSLEGSMKILEGFLFNPEFQLRLGSEEIMSLYFNMARYQCECQRNTIKIMELGLKSELLQKSIAQKQTTLDVEVKSANQPKLLELKNKLISIVERKLEDKAS